MFATKHWGLLLAVSVPTSVVRALSAPAAVAATKSSSIVKNVSVPGLKNGMDYVKLGDSDLVVPRVCMGTMTFGRQNTLEEGAEQLAHAYERYGVNFLDTAELYPVPGQPETQGKTDEAVSLFLKTVNREDVVVATKVSGRNPGMDYMPRRTPGTACEVNAEQIADSVDASLKRLGTDYVDLLQIHWPDRYVGGLFGQPDFLPDKYEGAPAPNDFAEQLAGLQEVVRSGKVRYVGVSNETPYGVCSFVNLARQFPDLYPKIVSIQNSYSLVVRKDFEAGLAEACYHHDVGLLAYSPLAGGTLTGKYRNKKSAPEGSRFSLFPGFMERYLYSQNEEAVNAYADVAERAGLTPTQLALSWCYHNPLVTSSIIGATTMEQLEENLRSYDVRLSEDVQEEISRTYKKYTDPTKARNS